MPTSPLPNCSVSLPPPLWDAVLVVVPLSPPHAARKAAAAVEPPLRARNLRRETGSATARATALRGGGAGPSGCVLSAISSPPRWFALLLVPYGRAGAAGSKSAISWPWRGGSDPFRALRRRGGHVVLPQSGEAFSAEALPGRRRRAVAGGDDRGCGLRQRLVLLGRLDGAVGLGLGRCRGRQVGDDRR